MKKASTLRCSEKDKEMFSKIVVLKIPASHKGLYKI